MKQLKKLLLPTLGCFILLLACNRSPLGKTERPQEAWVIRSVLDLKPRMLSVALDSNLWIAYNTQTAGLYKAWKGSINFDGPVYTSAHGPQPTSVGIAYLQEPDSIPWRVVTNGTAVIPEVTYKGHAIDDNKVTLTYALSANGKTITITEKPEYVKQDNGKVGFERIFTTEGVPAGSQVILKTRFASLASENDFETNGKFNAGRKETERVGQKQFQLISGDLVLNNNDETKITLNLTPKPALEAPTQEKLQGEEAVAALMAKSDCNTCHNRDVKTVGPAYKSIAEKYENNKQNLDALVTKVILGGAGNWGEIPMTPHPNLPREDAATMVSYILALDSDTEVKKVTTNLMPKIDFKVKRDTLNPKQMATTAEKPGVALNAYQFVEPVKDFPELTDEILPVFSGSINALHLDENDFGDLKDNFIIRATGSIQMDKTTNVVLRLVSDDGARLYIQDKLIIDNSGAHPMEAVDGEIILKAGKTPFRIDYYQGGGGKGLSLQWRPYGAKEFTVIPPTALSFKGSDIKKTQASPVVVNKDATPGDTHPLEAVHPSFTLAQARPKDFKPKVGGMDFLPDGRLVVSTWDSLGSVFVLDGVQGNNPEGIKVKRIAFGLAEPLGLKVVDGAIYVMQKQELTRLVDNNKDDIIDEYQTVCNGWKVSANFHEFAFGLVYKDGYFYGTLATAINPGGASTKPQIPDRGKVVKISKKDGSFELVSSGLRTPNGIGFGVDNEIFIADNQGDWLPASKIVHFQEGKWYGSRSVDFEGTANKTEMPPVVWLPQDEIGNSPSQPTKLNVGPYKNQMIHGEVTHGGIKRVFAEKVNGAYQGVVFRFTQGLEAGVNRLVWGPDGALYVGGVGSTGNWGHTGKLKYGLQRLTFNNKPTFEMLAVRAKANGVEIEFTQPLKEGTGTNASDYTIKQWWYKPTGEYGGPKLDEESLTIKSVNVSSDRKRVLLELPGMKAKHVVYIRLNRKTLTSSTGQKLWSTEAWYTMNNIPAGPERTANR
ncbi:MAG: PA14 domain-containing protein [Adhaeribacter sp.]